MPAKNEYTNESIRSLKDEDRVRKRPAVIFGSNGIEGCEHSIFEIMSNSIDEAREGRGNKIVITRFADCSVEVQDFGAGIPVDYNKAEKEENWRLLFCELYAGGKYDNNTGGDYTFSLGLNGLGACATQYASEYFDVEALEGDPAEALSHFGTRPGCFVLCAPGKRFLFKLRDPSVMRRLLPDMSEAYATLDVTILHSLVLESLLGIDKEDMAAGRSLTYTRDTAEAAAAPEEGKCAFSFILRATLVSQIRDVSLAGEKMPQKSTYFHPKPVTGLVINDLRSLK